MKRGIAIALTVLVLGGGGASAASTHSSSKSFEFDPTGAQAQTSAKSVKSSVNIAGVTGSVTGSVNSSKRKCEKGRLASLVLVTLTGIQFLDTEKTTKKGAFSLEGAVPGQAHIVGVGKKTVTKLRLGKPPKKLLCTQTESDAFVP